MRSSHSPGADITYRKSETIQDHPNLYELAFRLQRGQANNPKAGTQTLTFEWDEVVAIESIVSKEKMNA